MGRKRKWLGSLADKEVMSVRAPVGNCHLALATGSMENANTRVYIFSAEREATHLGIWAEIELRTDCWLFRIKK
jgi:hypothetical protein